MAEWIWLGALYPKILGKEGGAVYTQIYILNLKIVYNIRVKAHLQYDNRDKMIV